MLFISRPRNLVVQVPIGWLALAIGLSSQLARAPTHGKWTTWVLPAIFGIIAFNTFRVAKRVDKRIFVWGLFSRKTFVATKTVLGVLTRPGPRGSSISVELMAGDKVDLLAHATSLATYVPMGPEKAMRAAQRISEALDMPPARLAPWLVVGTTQDVPLEGWRRIASSRWFTFTLIAIAALGIVSALAMQNHLSHTEAELYLRCRRAHAIKLPIGQLTLSGSTGFTLSPGEATVEVWDAVSGCWTQRTLTLKKGVKEILDLDELAALRRCDRRGSPPP